MRGLRPLVEPWLQLSQSIGLLRPLNHGSFRFSQRETHRYSNRVLRQSSRTLLVKEDHWLLFALTCTWQLLNGKLRFLTRLSTFLLFFLGVQKLGLLFAGPRPLDLVATHVLIDVFEVVRDLVSVNGVVLLSRDRAVYVETVSKYLPCLLLRSDAPSFIELREEAIAKLL